MRTLINNLCKLPKTDLDERIDTLKETILDLSWELGFFANKEIFLCEIFYTVLFYDGYKDFGRNRVMSKNKVPPMVYLNEDNETGKLDEDEADFLKTYIEELKSIMHGLKTIVNNPKCVDIYNSVSKGISLFELCKELMATIYAYCEINNDAELEYLDNLCNDNYSNTIDLNFYDFNRFFVNDESNAKELYFPSDMKSSKKELVVLFEANKGKGRLSKVLLPWDNSYFDYLFGNIDITYDEIIISGEKYKIGVLDDDLIYREEDYDSSSLIAVNGYMFSEDYYDLRGYKNKIIVGKNTSDDYFFEKDYKASLNQYDIQTIKEHFQNGIFVYFEESDGFDERNIFEAYDNINPSIKKMCQVASKIGKEYYNSELSAYDLWDKYMYENDSYDDDYDSDGYFEDNTSSDDNTEENGNDSYNKDELVDKVLLEESLYYYDNDKYANKIKQFLKTDQKTLVDYIIKTFKKIDMAFSLFLNARDFKRGIVPGTLIFSFLFLDNITDEKVNILNEINNRLRFIETNEPLTFDYIYDFLSNNSENICSPAGNFIYGFKSVDEIEGWDYYYGGIFDEGTPFENIVYFISAISCLTGEISYDNIETIKDIIDGTMVRAFNEDFSDIDYSDLVYGLINGE